MTEAASATAPEEPAAVEPAASPPAAPEEPRVRRFVLPPAPTPGGGAPGALNLHITQGGAKPPPPPAKKPTPYEAAQRDSADSFEAQAARIGDSVVWTLERTAPAVFGGRAVPCGIFPLEFSGPATASEIGRVGGGGTYYINFTDPQTGKSKRLGPIKIAGAPKFDVGITDDGDDEDEGMIFSHAPSFRAGAAPPRERDDEWISTFHPGMGWMKRKKSDVEREGRMMATEPAIEAIRRESDAKFERLADMQRQQGETFKDMFRGLADAVKQVAATAAAASVPKEDVAGKFLEIERDRLRTESDMRKEEMKFLREKLEAEKAASDARLAHERDMAEKKLEAERERARAERESAEKKLEAERDRIAAEKEAAEERLAESARVANEKLEKTHETMMALMREKSNPMESVGGIFSLFRDFQEITGEPADPSEGKPKTKLERFLGLVEKAAEKAIPAIEPMLGHVVKTYMEQSQAAQAAANPRQVVHKQHPAAPQSQPQRQPQQQRPAKATPPPPEHPDGIVSAADEATDGVVSGAESNPADVTAGIDRLLTQVETMMTTGVHPSVAWRTLSESNPSFAPQLAAYKTPEQMAAELRGVAAMPGFGRAESIAQKITGEKKQWAKEFLAAVHKGA